MDEISPTRVGALAPPAARRRLCRAATAVAASLVAIGMLDPASARLLAQAPADTLRLGQAVAMARETNPALRAAMLRAEAAVERVSQAGALPDPMLGFGFVNRPVDDFGTDQAMTMNSLQLSQRLPWPGKLGFSAERMRRLAEAERLEASELEAVLIARVKGAYYKLAYIDRALVIMDETRDLLRRFLDVSSTLYEVGRGVQQDVLQAQIAVAGMTADITMMLENRVAMAARLNALLGRDATAPVGSLELPGALRTLPGADSLMRIAIAERPGLEAARERAAAAEAGYRAARRALYPDFTLGLGYGQRPEFDDLFTVSVAINIPVWAGSKQLPLRTEMRAMQVMEEARERDLHNETFARLAELTARAERARSLIELYTKSVVPQARASVESALSAYRVGQVDFMTLVTNEMTVNRYEIEIVRLVSDFHTAVADVEALIATELEEDR